MLKCSAFNEERLKFFGFKNFDLVVGQQPIIIRGKLRKPLGGACPASGMKPAERIVASVNFLSAIMRKRSAFLGKLLRNTM